MTKKDPIEILKKSLEDLTKAHEENLEGISPDGLITKVIEIRVREHLNKMFDEVISNSK